MGKKIVILMVALIFSVSIFSACGNSGESKHDTVTQQPTASVTPAETITAAPTPEPEDSYVPIQSGVRPYAVMIDNEGARVLPQGGLNMAQVIYEIIVEGGETRLMALFWGVNPAMIGPVRSARHYFLDYAIENDAIYVHYGQSPMALSDLKTLKINNINGIYVGKQVFWDLTKDRNNWQDTYTSMDKLKSYAGKIRYRITTQKDPEFEYNPSDTELVSVDNVQEIILKYSSAYNSSFKYDAQSRMYMRYRKGKPQMERVSGEQLEAKNIIIQIVKTSPISGDPKGRMDVQTVGSGKGYYITDGKKVNINWSKSSRSSQTRYTIEDGTDVKLNPGQTWIQIMPSSGKITLK